MLHHHYDNLLSLTMDEHKKTTDPRRKQLLLLLALKLHQARRMLTIAMLSLVGLLSACSTPPRQPSRCCHMGGAMMTTVADVKTCGCPKTATCGDCCGKEHCRCNPN